MRKAHGKRKEEANRQREGERNRESHEITHRGGGGGYSFVVRLSQLTVDHASLSRQSTVPTPVGDTSTIRAFITLFPNITQYFFAYLFPLRFRCLWPPSIT